MNQCKQMADLQKPDTSILKATMGTLQENIRQAKRSGSIEFFIEERNKEYVISRMPISKGMLNPFGVVQAGAMIWLADVTA